jgi:hypothetical protein
MAEGSGLSTSAGFSSAQLRRLFLPGLIAAVGLHAYRPIAITATLSKPLSLNENVMFLVEVIFYGFLISSAAKPIFYLYEGFRAPWLTLPAKRWNSRKLTRLQYELQELFAHNAQNSERAERIQSFLSDFPYKMVNGNYVFEAERTTRLGNLIASYELYPKRVHGVDGIYFWNHLTFLAPKESRDDVNEKSSWAESILLSSAAGALVAIVATTILFLSMLGGWYRTLAWSLAPESMWVACWTFLFGATTFGVFYRLSWPAYRDYRDAFRAMVDLAMPEFSEWISKAPVAFPAELSSDAAKVEDYLRTLAPHKRIPRPASHAPSHDSSP